MSRIFLSHSSVDEREAVALNIWLADNGWDDVFLDVDSQRGLVAGERWQEALRHAADRCEAVIFVVSPAWAKSKWCLAEFLLAKSLHKQIFGVILKDVPIGELPTEMTSEWQLCPLVGIGPTETIKFRRQDTDESISFLSDGLNRLKIGLKKAGLNADFFPWPPKEQPHRSVFRGLEPLEFEDAAVFFGRDVEILRGLEALRSLRDTPATRLFVILAASGAGKSSFLRAGLLPRLARDDRHFLPLRVIRPVRAPISGATGLAQALAQTMKELGLSGSNPGDVKTRLNSGADEFGSILRTLQEAVRTRLVAGEDKFSFPAPTVVVAVDQTEELFNADAGAEARQFLNLIGATLRRGQEPGVLSLPSLIIVFTIRSDRYEPLQTAPELAGLQTVVFDGLKPMSATRFREVITRPAERATTAVGRLELKPDLIDRLVEDSSAGADTLPLLSLTLERLYHDYGSDGDLRLNEYLALGGMANIVKNKVESVLDPVPERRRQQLALLQTAFIPWLVTINPQNDEPMRRVARRIDLPGESLPLIDALADNRLLTRDLRGGETVVEVAHEALLRQWDVLGSWLQEERAALKEADALERECRGWRASSFNESWLWGGQRLQDAMALAERAGFRKRLEGCCEFLECSRKQQEKRDAAQTAARQQAEKAAIRAKQQFKIATTLGLAAAGAALAAVLFYWQANRDREKAERNAVLSQAQALVAGAGQVRNRMPVQSVLLSAAALETTRRGLPERIVLPSAYQALRDALASVGGRALVGHESSVTAVAFSADDRWLVTGSADRTARLWDLKSADPAAQPIVLKGHEGSVYAVAFSADDRWLVTGSADRTARLWDLKSADPAAQPIVLKGHQGSVTAVAFSADNRWLVTSGGEKTARLWDLKSADPAAQPIVLKGHQDSVTAVAFSADSRWLVTGSEDQTACLWDLKSADPAAPPVVLKVVLGGHESPVTAVAFSVDNRWLVTGSVDKTARLWDLKSADPAAQPIVLKGHQGSVTAVAFSADNRWLVTSSGEKTARLWDLKAADPAAQFIVLKGHEGSVTAVAFSADNRWLVTGSQDRTARLWDLKTVDPAAQSIVLKGHEGWVTAVAFSADNRWLVTGSQDRTARLWDLKSADPAVQPLVLKGHEGSVTAVAFSADNRWLVTSSGEKAARLWDLKAADPAAQPTLLKGHEGSVYAVAFSADDRWLVTGSVDKTARLWDLKAADPAAQHIVLKGHEGWVTAVAFSADNRWLVTGSQDRTAHLWDLKAADPAAQPIVFKGHQGSVTAVAFSADNRWLVTSSVEKTARLWDLKAADPAAQPIVLKGHQDAVLAVAFSANNRWLVTGSMDGTARLWDLKAADPAAQPIVLKGQDNDWITAVAFSADNRWLVTTSSDKARLWDLKAADPAAQPIVFKGQDNDWVTSVAFSADSRWLVTGCVEKTARLWDLKAADPAAQPIVLKGHDGLVYTVAFSADNQWVVTGSEDKTARLWLLQIEDLLALARRTAGRNLSKDEWHTFMPNQPYFEVFPGLPIPRK